MDTQRLEITTWHVEMLRPDELRPSRNPDVPVDVSRAQIPSPEFGRFLYTAVGGPWYWTDRLDWDYEAWRRYLARPEVEIWVAYSSGTPAGYAELERQPENGVEIVQFGLLPQFIGQGIGGYLLTTTIRRAWALGAHRVWLHTCSLDGPHALANYRARGMRVYQETISITVLPVSPPGPWPGART
jgi:GNAT superfamily N-acetyltransferase